jgi:hypothetical protein
MNDQQEQIIFAELSELEKTLKADTSGERARALMAYFSNLAHESQSHALSLPPGAERQVSGQLTEAFEACQRIIQKVWGALNEGQLS